MTGGWLWWAGKGVTKFSRIKLFHICPSPGNQHSYFLLSPWHRRNVLHQNSINVFWVDIRNQALSQHTFQQLYQLYSTRKIFFRIQHQNRKGYVSFYKSYQTLWSPENSCLNYIYLNRFQPYQISYLIPIHIIWATLVFSVRSGL